MRRYYGKRTNFSVDKGDDVYSLMQRARLVAKGLGSPKNEKGKGTPQMIYVDDEIKICFGTGIGIKVIFCAHIVLVANTQTGFITKYCAHPDWEVHLNDLYQKGKEKGSIRPWT